MPLAALLAALLLAPAADAAGPCAGGLPAKAKPPSRSVSEFESRGYIDVRPRHGAKLRGVTVKLRSGKTVVARGAAEGKIEGRRSVPLEFLKPLEADRAYEIVVSGRARGCKGRASAKDSVSLTDPGGGGSASEPGANVQGLVIDWSGGKFEGADSAEVNLPGIGRAVAVCRPDTTWLRVLPDDPGRSTAMLLYTFRTSSEATFGSVREAVTTPFTGPDFNEGFNVSTPPEARSTGTFTGVISDRLPFGSPGGTGAPPTVVELSWNWNFAGGTDSSCSVTANFTTEAAGTNPPVARSLAVNWSGDGNAIGNGAAATEVPGLGNARVDCQAAGGIRRFTLFPQAGVGPVTFTAYEGSDVTTSAQSQGPYRYELPNNGLVTADVDGDDRTDLFLSSRWKANDPDPAQNFCHLAGVVVAR